MPVIFSQAEKLSDQAGRNQKEVRQGRLGKERKKIIDILDCNIENRIRENSKDVKISEIENEKIDINKVLEDKKNQRLNRKREKLREKTIN